MAVAAVPVIILSAFNLERTYGSFDDATLRCSRAAAFVMVLLYLAYLGFQKTHDMFFLDLDHPNARLEEAVDRTHEIYPVDLD